MPYYLKSKGIHPEGVYVRQGASSVPASEERIKAMIIETDGTVYEDLRSLEQKLTFITATQEFSSKALKFGAVQHKRWAFATRTDCTQISGFFCQTNAHT